MQYFEYRNESFPFTVTRKRVKYINARMKSDGVIYVSAPYGVSLEIIRSMLLANAERFRLARLHAAERAANRPDCSDGSVIRYLGNPITLCYDQTARTPFLEDEALYLSADTPAEAMRLVRHWLKERSLLLYSRINREVCEDFRRHGFDVPLAHVTIKDMTSRWGSCSPASGRISMNLRLIQYPEQCIYAVFYHEYAHFLEANHSSRFYAVLESVCPAYREWDAPLKNRSLSDTLL